MILPFHVAIGLVVPFEQLACPHVFANLPPFPLLCWALCNNIWPATSTKYLSRHALRLFLDMRHERAPFHHSSFHHSHWHHVWYCSTSLHNVVLAYSLHVWLAASYIVSIGATTYEVARVVDVGYIGWWNWSAEGGDTGVDCKCIGNCLATTSQMMHHEKIHQV